MRLNKGSCLKEKSMTIPPLKTINKLVLRSHEIFIAAGGFEDRIFKFSQIVTPDKAKGNKAVLLDYRPSESKNKLGDLKEILTKKGLDVDIIVYDRYEPEDFGGRFKDILLRNNINSLCLDISGMSKLAIMIIMDVVRELNLSLRIVYAEALEYAPSKSDFEKLNALSIFQRHLSIQEGYTTY